MTVSWCPVDCFYCFDFLPLLSSFSIEKVWLQPEGLASTLYNNKMWKNDCMHIQLYCFYWYMISNYFKAVKILFSFLSLFFVFVVHFCRIYIWKETLCQDTANLLCLLKGVNRRCGSFIPVTTHQLSDTKGSFGTGQVNDRTKLFENKPIKQNQKLHVIKVLNLLICSFQMCARVESSLFRPSVNEKHLKMCVSDILSNKYL